MVRPTTTYEYDIPSKLWDWMAMYEKKTGGKVLAIPHNGKLSNGLVFALETPDGLPIDKQWAETRARWEPLVEVTQSKGVPMGGDLPPAPMGAKAPRLLVSAAKDPIGGNLDRIQIIRGWVDADGEMHPIIMLLLSGFALATVGESLKD